MLAALAPAMEGDGQLLDDDLFGVFEPVLATAGRLLDAVRLRLDQQIVVDRASVRRLWTLADVLLAIVRGLLYHRVANERDFEELDEDEFRTWLVRHGALAESTTSSLVRTVAYDLPFGTASDPDLAPVARARPCDTLPGLLHLPRGDHVEAELGHGRRRLRALYELLHKPT